MSLFGRALDCIYFAKLGLPPASFDQGWSLCLPRFFRCRYLQYLLLLVNPCMPQHKDVEQLNAHSAAFSKRRSEIGKTAPSGLSWLLLSHLSKCPLTHSFCLAAIPCSPFIFRFFISLHALCLRPRPAHPIRSKGGAVLIPVALHSMAPWAIGVTLNPKTDLGGSQPSP